MNHTVVSSWFSCLRMKWLNRNWQVEFSYYLPSCQNSVFSIKMLLHLHVCYYVNSYVHSHRTRIHVLLLFKPTVWRQGDRSTCACKGVRRHADTHTHTHTETERNHSHANTSNCVCAFRSVQIFLMAISHRCLIFISISLHQKHQLICRHPFVWCWLFFLPLRIQVSNKVIVHVPKNTVSLHFEKISLVKVHEFS